MPQSICTMFNVMVDAKVQSAKLCTVDLGQEVRGSTLIHRGNPTGPPVELGLLLFIFLPLSPFFSSLL